MVDPYENRTLFAERVPFRFRIPNRSKAFVLAGLIVTFGIGFTVALFLRPGPAVQATTARPTDFRIPLPEGSSRITIIDRQISLEPIARFEVQRSGNSITGTPIVEKVIPPRSGLSAEDAAFFRRELTGVVSPSNSAWERANRIRDWLSSGQHKVAMPGLATRIAREAYEQMRSGQPVLCGNLAEIYVAFVKASGLKARTVGLSLMIRDGAFGSDTHAGAEVWIPELGRWVYQDPSFNSYWQIDGAPASALQLHDALMEKRNIELVAQDAEAESLVKNYYVDPRLFFRHVSYEYQAGGILLYYVDGRLEPLNLHDQNWIQTDNREDIDRLDEESYTIIERRGEIAPGIFVQVIGNDLFVRDRREQNRGISVRSSGGRVQVCSYDHLRAEELSIFHGQNLVQNGTFTITGKSEGVAEGWDVSGPVEVLGMLGGQGMGAQPGGKLWQRLEVKPNRRYLMYASVSVPRGVVVWKLADAARGMDSKGVIKPTQMKEIVSDVVESRSGYLDVSFELVEAGGFRVMNVIVIELRPASGASN